VYPLNVSRSRPEVQAKRVSMMKLNAGTAFIEHRRCYRQL
jgi:hypothetical protein